MQEGSGNERDDFIGLLDRCSCDEGLDNRVILSDFLGRLEWNENTPILVRLSEIIGQGVWNDLSGHAGFGFLGCLKRLGCG